MIDCKKRKWAGSQQDIRAALCFYKPCFIINMEETLTPFWYFG